MQKFTTFISEGIKHDRYERAHGKKAKGSGMWMFTTKRMGDPTEDEVFMSGPNMSLAAAGKEAMKALKSKEVYVMESVELDEALQSVTKIKFDYKDTMPKNPKPSDVGGLKQDWNNDRMAVRSAIKPLGGLVTDSEAPSRANKFVGTLSIGTRGDASKLSNSAIQKAVKSKGAEIQNNQFMSESVESLDEVKLSDMGIHNKLANRNLLIKAIKTAEKMGGNMTGAVREIEKMKKGLSKHKAVQAALQQANESVELDEAAPKLGKKGMVMGKDNKNYKIEMIPSTRKIEFKVTSEFGDFKTVSLGQLAKMFR